MNEEDGIMKKTWKKTAIFTMAMAMAVNAAPITAVTGGLFGNAAIVACADSVTPTKCFVQATSADQITLDNVGTAISVAKVREWLIANCDAIKAQDPTHVGYRDFAFIVDDTFYFALLYSDDQFNKNYIENELVFNSFSLKTDKNNVIGQIDGFKTWNASYGDKVFLWSSPTSVATTGFAEVTTVTEESLDNIGTSCSVAAVKAWIKEHSADYAANDTANEANDDKAPFIFFFKNGDRLYDVILDSERLNSIDDIFDEALEYTDSAEDKQHAMQMTKDMLGWGFKVYFWQEVPATSHALTPVWSWSKESSKGNWTATVTLKCPGCGEIIVPATEAEVTSNTVSGVTTWTATYVDADGREYTSEKVSDPEAFADITVYIDNAERIYVNGIEQNELARVQCHYGDQVKVVADPGQCWFEYIGGDDYTKLNNSPTYYFYATRDMSIAAGMDSIEYDEVLCSMNVDRVSAGNNKHKISFTVDWDLPEYAGYTVVEAGVIRTYDENVGKSVTPDTDFIIGKTGVTKKASTLKTTRGTYKYNLTLNTTNSQKTVYSRGYVTYKVGDGDAITVYTDVNERDTFVTS
jgi:hypothetical protein